MLSFTIPQNVISIGKNVFEGCKISVLKTLAKTPPSTDSPINIDSLEVPLRCISKYTQSDYWKNIKYIYAKSDKTIYVNVLIIEEGGSVVQIVGYDGNDIEVPLGSNIEIKPQKEMEPYDAIYHKSKNITEIINKNGSYSFRASLDSNYNENYILTYSSPSQYDQTIHVSTAGTLIDLVGIDNLENISSIKISGDLNGTDILTIRKMENLKFLDMEDANIINGGASYYENYTTSKDAIGEYFFKNKSNLTMILLPLSANIIKQNAFSDCSNLASITIPNSVASIGNSAFMNCSNLASITIPNSVKSIGGGAFSGCSGLKSVTILCPVVGLWFSEKTSIKELILGDKVTSIGKESFRGCTNLTSVTLLCPSVGDSWFKGFTSIKEIILGNGVTSIGESAFEGCSGLTSITIPNSVTSIGKNAFHGCSGLTSITIPNCVLSIGESAFEGCRGLTSINIPNSVTSIESSAFYGCSRLTSITIPNSVTSIGSSAFKDCISLTSINIPSSVTSIGSSAFSGCSGLTSITIPNSVTSIGDWAFSGCSGLTSIMIPNSIMIIGKETFKNCNNLVSVTLLCPSVGDSWFKDITSIREVILGDEVTSIGDNAFSGCSGFTSITMPNSVTSIGSSAFSGCSGLTSINIPNSVTSIGNYAFSGCSSLTSVTINCQNVGSWFQGNTSIKEVVLGDGIKYIGNNAFKGCSGLTSITIPNSVTSIGESAFLGCSGLTSITIPNSVTSIGERAFEGCSGLASINIPNSVTSIGKNAFHGCSGLTSVTIPNSVTSIGNYAFAYCSGLTSVTSLNTIPPKIESNTFPNYSATLYVPKGCKTIYWLHPYWENFTMIEEIEVGYYTLTYLVDNEVYKTYTFMEGDAITPETEPTKEGYTFSGWSEIPSTMPAHDVTVSGTFTQIDFIVDNVTYEVTESGVTLLNGSNYSGDVVISTTVKINGTTYNVTAIAENAFKGNANISSVTIPNSITQIGSGAFDGCSNLIVINIGKAVVSIGSKAFANICTTSAQSQRRAEKSKILVNCYAESIPVTSNDAFENTPIATSTLCVNDNDITLYKTTSPWNQFGSIYGFNEYTGIDSILIDDMSKAKVFTLDGQQIQSPKKGINIIRMKNGKTMKVINK